MANFAMGGFFPMPLSAAVAALTSSPVVGKLSDRGSLVAALRRNRSESWRLPPLDFQLHLELILPAEFPLFTFLGAFSRGHKFLLTARDRASC